MTYVQETDDELYARMLKASAAAKKNLARYAHVKEPPGISMLCGRPETKEDEALMPDMQKPKTKSIKPKAPMNNAQQSKEDREIMEIINRARPEAKRRAAKAAANIKKQVEQALAESATARARVHKASKTRNPTAQTAKSKT